jgi:aryl-alcohol dehydrogenase-like predicted oxidoreductase
MDLEEPLRAVDALLRDGKIRYWGLSNFRGWRIAEAVHLARALNMPGPVVCQPYYNLLNRQPEVEVLPACAHHGLGVVPYSPIARGVLAGKYAPGAAHRPPARAPAAATSASWRPSSAPSRCIAQTLKAHCEAKGVALAHFATAWVLAHQAVSAVIAGPRTWRSGRTTSARWTWPSTRRRSPRRCAGQPGPPVDAGLQRPGLSAGRSCATGAASANTQTLLRPSALAA